MPNYDTTLSLLFCRMVLIGTPKLNVLTPGQGEESLAKFMRRLCADGTMSMLYSTYHIISHAKGRQVPICTCPARCWLQGLIRVRLLARCSVHALSESTIAEHPVTLYMTSQQLSFVVHALEK